MENRFYLAMTAAEFQNCSSFPEKAAWMSCHFSSYGKGLSNFPQRLPADSMLILDDSCPICGHAPEIILHQLSDTIHLHKCSCVLLDFQRSASEEATAMVTHLTNGLPCPVIVSHIYAKDSNCNVLLPPVPPDVPLPEYIQPWAGRDIWLELSLSNIGYRITKEGAQTFAPANCPDAVFYDDPLFCHYSMDIQADHVDFILQRTWDDLAALMEQAKKLGVTHFVGLWQELQR